MWVGLVEVLFSDYVKASIIDCTIENKLLFVKLLFINFYYNGKELYEFATSICVWLINRNKHVRLTEWIDIASVFFHGVQEN